jgi:hypothetical protein
MAKVHDDFKEGYKKEYQYNKNSKSQDYQKFLLRFGLSSAPLEFELPDKAEYYITKWAKGEKFKAEEIGKALAVAEELLKTGVKENNPLVAHIGAILYDRMGYGNRNSVVRRLQKAYDNGMKAGVKLPAKNEKLITDFLAEHEGNNLASKLLTSVFGAFTIAGLLFGVNSVTGAVTGVSSNSFGILGVALFLGGIFGLFFSIKK